MPELAESQFELGGIVFGRGCPVEVIRPDWGSPDITDNDQPLPSRDGVVFGRDTHGSTTLSFDVMTNGATAEDGLAAWNALASVWTDPARRLRPRAVSTLRLRSWGGQERTVYGRPRGWEPASTDDIRVGLTTHMAEFVMADSSYYGSEFDRVLTMDPAPATGFTFPITFPLQLGPVSTTDSHTLTNPGDRSAWPVITIAGPIVNPAVTILSTGVRFAVTTTLTHTQTLTIDPRPWVQEVRRSDGAHLRGAASPIPMEQLRLPPGPTVIQFTGQDPTGQSSCRVSWRPAYSTPGGAS